MKQIIQYIIIFVRKKCIYYEISCKIISTVVSQDVNLLIFLILELCISEERQGFFMRDRYTLREKSILTL
jgi:hypothetical protein